MKKILGLLFILAGLSGITVPALWSAEGGRDNPIIQTDSTSFMKGVALFYSYESGQWISSQPGKIFTTGGETADFELPFLKHTPQPIQYPRWALKQGFQGELVVAVEILENGTVGRWQIMQSTRHPSLDEAAVKAMKTWRFEPGKLRGKAIVSCVQIPIRFRVD